MSMRILMTIFLSLAIISCNASLESKDFTVTSKSFEHDKMMPKKFSCQGAIIMHDPDAPMEGGFTHWVVWNIDPKTNVKEGFSGGQQGMNTADKKGYVGMCPPSGTHHYHFRVYALDTELNLDENTDKDALEKAMNGHIVAQDLLTGLYKKE